MLFNVPWRFQEGSDIISGKNDFLVPLILEVWHITLVYNAFQQAVDKPSSSFC
jgi:hypothetical protein